MLVGRDLESGRLAALLADGYLRREGLDAAELYVLVLLSASGGVIMASANDLIVLFIGLGVLATRTFARTGATSGANR